ncbi:MAG: nicotinic acid mononucleotide adenyltransferase, partial [Flavobacteriaceae bacterium]
QEYEVWEKVYASDGGALNDFDRENYLQFFPSYFRSSVDEVGTATGALQWDFVGDYQVYDTENDETLKTLTLAYDFLGNDYFELYVINDVTIELYHVASGSVYEFRGRGYQQYLKSGKGTVDKKRTKTVRPVMKVKRSRAL